MKYVENGKCFYTQLSLFSYKMDTYWHISYIAIGTFFFVVPMQTFPLHMKKKVKTMWEFVHHLGTCSLCFGGLETVEGWAWG